MYYVSNEVFMSNINKFILDKTIFSRLTTHMQSVCKSAYSLVYRLLIGRIRMGKSNAFWVFTEEFIKSEREAGRKHPREQWASIATPHYNALPASEKEKYKQMAKEQDNNMALTTKTKNKGKSQKFTSQGIPLEEVERELEAAKEKELQMKNNIKTLVENGFLNNDIKTKPFIFIMANYFCKTQSGLFVPAEIAVAKFTFEGAIDDELHTFVNPSSNGSIPLGYGFEAKDRSEKFHRLPWIDAMGEQDYKKIYHKILGILDVQPDGTFDDNDQSRLRVYTRLKDKPMIESILDQFSDGDWRRTFDVYVLEVLFNELKNNVALEKVPVNVTSQFIENDRFEYTPNISCDFHEVHDVPHNCALSYVRRWFYLFSDHMCERIGIELVPGRNLPAIARVQRPTRWEDGQAGNPFDRHSFALTDYANLCLRDEYSSDED